MNNIPEYNTVKLIRSKNGYATLLLNRPEILNAMNPSLIQDMTQACHDINADESIRAVIMTGAGRAFCAGGDVHEDVNPLRSMPPHQFNEYMSEAMNLYQAILNIEVPVICAINGIVVGGGFDITLCCDIRMASEKAQMGEFFVRMGLAPEVGSFLLPRIIGDGWAKRLAMTGDLIDAQKALDIGLVEEIFPHEKLIPAAEKLATQLANGPTSIKAIKKAINSSYDMSLAGAVDHTLRLQYQLSQTADHNEAVSAWIEKRKPVFVGH